MRNNSLFSSEIGVPFVEKISDIWEDPSIHGVCITAPTSMHKELVLSAAEAGKDIFIEKTLALTKADAEEMAAAVERNHVNFSIVYIRCTTGPFLFAKRILDSGILGDITMARVRNGHDQALTGVLPPYWFDPAQTGGGAMTDLGCHQMYLMDWLFGMPDTISSSFAFHTGKKVEDSGVCTAIYHTTRSSGGAGERIVIIDSSFTSFYSPYTFELYGEKGTLLVRLDKNVEVYLPQNVSPWFVEELGQAVECSSSDGRNCYRIRCESLPDDPSPVRQWCEACIGRTKAPFGMESAVRLSAMIEGANQAFQTGKAFHF